MAVSAFTQLGATFSNSTSGATTLSPGAITLPNASQDVLAVALIAISGTATAETITVSDGTNTWTTVAAQDNAGSGGAHTAIAYRNYPSNGGTNQSITPTASWGTAVNERFAVFGYLTGHDPASPLDTSGVGSPAGIGSTTSQSATTSGSAAAGGTAVTAFTVGDDAITSGFPGTGWTSIANPADTASRHRNGAFSYQQLASSGTVTAGAYTFGASSITPPSFSIAVFKPPGGPINTTPPAITGTAALGNTLTVDTGTWTNSPTGYTYLWRRSSDSGATWNNCTDYALDGGATTNSHTVVGFDVGSILQCVVTASNAAGSSAQPSNSTSQVQPQSGTPSIRLVTFPATQSDDQVHSKPLVGAVLPNETLVLIASTSIGNRSGDMGSVSDPNGNTWTLDHDTAFGGPGTNTGHVTQSFSAQNGASKLNIGATITNNIKQTTVVGAHAADSPTIKVANISIWDPGGANVNLGPGSTPTKGTVTYTGVDVANSLLTGCGTHSALVDGDLVIYHGQSPYWAVYALNPGDGTSTRLAFDQAAAQHVATATPAAGPITTTKTKGVAVTLGVSGNADANHWMTPGSGWTNIFAGYFANHLTGGASDSDGIQYSGESQYKTGVQTRTYSSAGTSITGNYTHDGTAATFMDTMVVAYGFDPAGGSPVTVTPGAATAGGNTPAAVVTAKSAPPASSSTAPANAPVLRTTVTAAAVSASGVTPTALAFGGSLAIPARLVTVTAASAAEVKVIGPPG